MTKLCTTESHAYGTCKIIYSLNCQYFNNEKTFVRTTEVKQCVLHCFLKTALLSANLKYYIFQCILLRG